MKRVTVGEHEIAGGTAEERRAQHGAPHLIRGVLQSGPPLPALIDATFDVEAWCPVHGARLEATLGHGINDPASE